MISDLSGADTFPMVLTRNKRDEFLIEIRKKKNRHMILKKRANFSKNSDEGVCSPTETKQFFEANSKDQIQRSTLVNVSAEDKKKLEESFKLFYDALNRQAWEDLIPVIKFLRDNLGEEPCSIPGQVIINMGIIPHALGLLAKEFYQYKILQSEIVWLLANISAGNSQDTEYLVEQNVISILSYCLINNPAEELHENIMWVLANISAESNLDYRDFILHRGVLNKVVRDLNTTPKRNIYYRTAAWLISNLVRGKPFPPFEEIERCFGALTHLIDYNDEGIKQNSLLSLIYLTEELKETHLKKITENNLVFKTVKCLNHGNEKVCLNAIKVLGNLATGSKEIIKKLYENEVLKASSRILRSNSKDLKKAICGMLVNMLLNDFGIFTYVVDYAILPVIIEFAKTEEDELKDLATQFLLQFIANCSLDYVKIAIEEGLLTALFKNFTCNQGKVVENSLVILYKILECGEDLKESNNGNNPWFLNIKENNLIYIIENLQENPNAGINEKLMPLFDKFFVDEP